MVRTWPLEFRARTKASTTSTFEGEAGLDRPSGDDGRAEPPGAEETLTLFSTCCTAGLEALLRPSACELKTCSALRSPEVSEDCFASCRSSVLLNLIWPDNSPASRVCLQTCKFVKLDREHDVMAEFNSYELVFLV
eukprot:SAG31_NODE_13311_length_878_cov_0.987163_1_plen_136_part_00